MLSPSEDFQACARQNDNSMTNRPLLITSLMSYFCSLAHSHHSLIDLTACPLIYLSIYLSIYLHLTTYLPNKLTNQLAYRPAIQPDYYLLLPSSEFIHENVLVFCYLSWELANAKRCWLAAIVRAVRDARVQRRAACARTPFPTHTCARGCVAPFTK